MQRSKPSKHLEAQHWAMVSAIGLVMLIGLVAPMTQAAGRTYRTGWLSITINDPGDQNRIAGVIETLQRAKQDASELGLSVPQITLEATTNAAQFTRLTGEPAGIAAITNGTKIVTQRLNALQARGRLTHTIRHELFHTAQPPRMPRWLAEGLARHFSGEHKNDPLQVTGLETKTEQQLNEMLQSRTSHQALNQAYVEASKRAVKLIRTNGWKRTLERQ
jgi:hypothetical protein